MKTFLFVDGTNLYAAQYELFGPKKYLNFPKFLQEIEKRLKVKFNKILFYASYTPKTNKASSKAKEYIINEFKFYKTVKKTENLTFFKGYRSKTSGKEKEVDVKLTADLVGFGLLDYYDEAYLMSGDADFLQAIRFVKTYKSQKKLKLICFPNKILYKGLYYYPSYVIKFVDFSFGIGRIARKAQFINIKASKILCEIKKRPRSSVRG